MTTAFTDAPIPRTRVCESPILRQETRMTPMNVRGCLGLVVVLAASTAVAQPSRAPLDRETTAETQAQTTHDEVLRLAPAGAWFIAHSTDFAGLAKYRFLTQFSEPESGLPIVAEALAGAIDGTAMISLSGMPINPLTWSVSLAARTSYTRDELFQYFTNTLVPAWNGSLMTRRLGKMQFLPVRGHGQIMIIGPAPIFLTVAVRDGLFFGSTQPGEAENWFGGAEIADPFVESEEFARLNRGRRTPVGNLLYLDLRSLIPAAVAEMNRVMPNLGDALQLDKVESLALIGDRPPDSVTSRAKGPDAPKPGLRLAVGVNEVRSGVTRLLASTPATATLARVFPSDTTVLLHGSMERASGLADDVFAFAAVIGEEIADEYAEERADFKEEFGFDPHTEFLANFVKEWAIGARMSTTDESVNPLVAVRLESPGAFKAFMHRLVAGFDLEIRRTSYRDVIVEHAERRSGSFVYAVAGDVLLVSTEAATVRKAIDAALGEKDLAHAPEFVAARRQLPPQTSKLLFVDVAGLFAEGVGEAEAEELVRFPGIAELVESGAGLALAVTPHPQMIAFEVSAGGGDPLQLADVLAMSLTSSIKRARYLSQRTVSISNVKNILTVCKIYANNHETQWPRSLEQVVAEDLLKKENVFLNPYRPNRGGSTPYYLYRFFPEGEKTKNPGEQVVVSEPFIDHGGAVFGFMDGRAEWIASPRADQLLAEMRGGN